MGVVTASRYCPHCNEDVMVACSAGADFLHLILTLLSGGMWGLVWWHSRFRAQACLCCQCGRSLPRTRLKFAPRPPLGNPCPLDPAAQDGSEFNTLLVTRNLVYYVPTSARFGRAAI